MLGFVTLLHVVGFDVLVLFVAPAHYSLGTTGVYGIGVGVLAYTLGMRHAFDADHIAAIDNTTRKLMADGGRKPLSVGFWFALGHSTIVFGRTFLLSIGVRALAGPVADDDSTLHAVTGVIGSSVSGVFLWLIGLLNLVVLVGIVGALMNFAYGWAFARSIRKVYYNITITALSVAVALVIGTIELIGVLVDQTGLVSGPLVAIANVPLDCAGYAIVALFVIAWIVAVTVWKLGRVEQRWSTEDAVGE